MDHRWTLNTPSHLYSSFWHSLLSLRDQPYWWHETAHFLALFQKNGAKGACRICHWDWFSPTCCLSLSPLPSSSCSCGPCQVQWFLCSVVTWPGDHDYHAWSGIKWEAPPAIHLKGSLNPWIGGPAVSVSSSAGKWSLSTQVRISFHQIYLFLGGKTMMSMLERVCLCSYWVCTSDKDRYSVPVLTFLSPELTNPCFLPFKCVFTCNTTFEPYKSLYEVIRAELVLILQCGDWGWESWMLVLLHRVFWKNTWNHTWNGLCRR